MTNKDARLKGTLLLAFVGDVAYEIRVRRAAVEKNLAKPKELHNFSSKMAGADFQSKALEFIYDELSETEKEIVRRGRNSKPAHIPKNRTPEEYQNATALEALFGYLELADDKERLDRLFSIILNNMKKLEN